MKLFLLPFVLLAGCASTPKHAPITAAARTSVQQAATATSEASKASERSSAHIRAFTTAAQRIDYKASRALQLVP